MVDSHKISFCGRSKAGAAEVVSVLLSSATLHFGLSHRDFFEQPLDKVGQRCKNRRTDSLTPLVLNQFLQRALAAVAQPALRFPRASPAADMSGFPKCPARVSRSPTIDDR
jgi:hypothetical protein